MFDLLKKKISSFVQSIANNASRQEWDENPAVQEQSPGELGGDAQPHPAPIVSHKATSEIHHAPDSNPEAKGESPKVREVQVEREADRSQKVHITPEVHHNREIQQVQPKQDVHRVRDVATRQEIHHNLEVGVKPAVPQVNEVKMESRPVSQHHAPERDFAPKIGIIQRLKSVFSHELELKEGDVAPVLGDFETALLEADVSYPTAQHMVAQLRGKLVGARVNRSDPSGEIKAAIRQSLVGLFGDSDFDFFNYLSALKARNEVAVVLFVGPNGAGKTTTIAKIADSLGKRGFSCVISASDTFRKAAIEQASLHGEKLGVRVVKQTYGSDPTAVAFDAIAHAKASRSDVVLIDTAGRQETNANLVREMEKMARVLHPHLKLFVGEAVAGNALAEQAASFNKAISLDGIVLTKMDCDAKGGGAFSIAFETKLPIVFVGIGQEYGDIRPFDAEWFVGNVMAA